MRTKENLRSIASKVTSSGVARTRVPKALGIEWRGGKYVHLLDPVGEVYPLLISPRDLQIVQFLLEMKFAGREELYQKFFSRTLSGEKAKNGLWARDRLAQLEKSQVLSAFKVDGINERFYRATWKSHRILSQVKFGAELAQPLRYVDSRVLDHDRTVIWSRLYLEENEGVTSWISDHMLRTVPAFKLEMSESYLPDAIYTNQNGERVALEIEIAQKKMSRYRDKIQTYVKLLRQDRASRPFDHVRFLVSKKQVMNHLENETKIFPNYFTIESLDKILKPEGNSK